MNTSVHNWKRRKLTGGSATGNFHAHAYYDLPVFDSESRLVAGHRVNFENRPPDRNDAVEIGYIDLEGNGHWEKTGESRAWSWQQGAMSQWLPGKRELIWNDRENDRFISRIHTVDTSLVRTFSRPVYAVTPDGLSFCSLNMARLDYVRPGYGYADGENHFMHQRIPGKDGVWKVDIETGRERLLLSLKDAVDFLWSILSDDQRSQHRSNRYIYWFNHVKISPDGKRFTVKLRFRAPDLTKGWNGRMGVSLTCGMDGKDIRFLAHASSHVIWLNKDHLYFWREDGVYLYKDEPDRGVECRRIAEETIHQNVHIRQIPGMENLFIYDTPYRENVDVLIYDDESQTSTKIASFTNHIPARGPFRCDLHPCPSPDGKKILVTSPEDGGRQMYLLRKV